MSERNAEDRLGKYLAEIIGLGPSPSGTTLTLVGGGRSNLTYFVDHAGCEYVLRRPPAGITGASGHDVGREYRIIDALCDTPVPVPRPIAYCEDLSVIGTPFYLMQRVPGRVLARSADAPDLQEASLLRKLAAEVIAGLLVIQEVDVAQVGLAGLGRASGYVERQVDRWTRQWAERHQRSIPALDEVGRRLRCALSTGAVDKVPHHAYLVHGDYNLGNVIVAGPDSFAGGTVLRAILDWEMSTLGHPLMDLGLLTAYNGPLGHLILECDELVSDLPGFPKVPELVELYAKGSSVDVTAFDFFHVLAFYKMVVITEDVRARYVAGATDGDGFESMGKSAATLADALLDYAGRSSIVGLNGR
jgi:aminoglycoside phosphotransferase (APT) family kinase protein